MSDWKNSSDIEYVMNNIIKNRIMDMAETMRKQRLGIIKSDVIGSYTGESDDDERPTQDADDL